MTKPRTGYAFSADAQVTCTYPADGPDGPGVWVYSVRTGDMIGCVVFHDGHLTLMDMTGRVMSTRVTLSEALTMYITEWSYGPLLPAAPVATAPLPESAVNPATSLTDAIQALLRPSYNQECPGTTDRTHDEMTEEHGCCDKCGKWARSPVTADHIKVLKGEYCGEHGVFHVTPLDGSPFIGHWVAQRGHSSLIFVTGLYHETLQRDVVNARTTDGRKVTAYVGGLSLVSEDKERAAAAKGYDLT